jgi:hypothetical protein
MLFLKDIFEFTRKMHWEMGDSKSILYVQLKLTFVSEPEENSVEEKKRSNKAKPSSERELTVYKFLL